MSNKENDMIDVNSIPAGTEVTFAHAPAERWRVVGPSQPGRFEFPTYVCEQIAGDTATYRRDRNEDGTIDMDGEAIAEALA